MFLDLGHRLRRRLLGSSEQIRRDVRHRIYTESRVSSVVLVYVGSKAGRTKRRDAGRVVISDEAASSAPEVTASGSTAGRCCRA